MGEGGKGSSHQGRGEQTDGSTFPPRGRWLVWAPHRLGCSRTVWAGAKANSGQHWPSLVVPVAQGAAGTPGEALRQSRQGTA